jgi:hypothetical protein
MVPYLPVYSIHSIHRLFSDLYLKRPHFPFPKCEQTGETCGLPSVFPHVMWESVANMWESVG